MYRIIFIPAIGKWVVQIQCCLIFWKSIKQLESIGSEKRTSVKHSLLTWDNYTEAAKHVSEIGLEAVYKNYHQTNIHQILASKVTNAVEQLEASIPDKDFRNISKIFTHNNDLATAR